MSAVIDKDRELLRQVVCGDRPVDDLAALGMTLQREGDRFSVVNPRGISTSIGVSDLAKGLLAYVDKPEALREWAMFINASDLDLDLENHHAGELVLQALWDASFKNPMAAETKRALQELLASNGQDGRYPP